MICNFGQFLQPDHKTTRKFGLMIQGVFLTLNILKLNYQFFFVSTEFKVTFWCRQSTWIWFLLLQDFCTPFSINSPISYSKRMIHWNKSKLTVFKKKLLFRHFFMFLFYFNSFFFYLKLIKDFSKFIVTKFIKAQ